MTEIGLQIIRLLSTTAVVSLLLCLGGSGADPESIEDEIANFAGKYLLTLKHSPGRCHE